MFTPKMNEASTKRVTARVILLAAMLVVAGGITTLGATTAVYAERSSDGAGSSTGHGTPPLDPGRPNDPNCWGEANSGAAQDFGGIGEHASDPFPGDTDRETPRRGVGNQAEDTPPEHGETVAPAFQQTCDPDDTGSK
jgi:hypothetical protein